MDSVLVGHLGMTGRMYLSRRDNPLPKHAAVVLNLGNANFIFEDTRYFGKFTLDTEPLAKLGPEPLEKSFTSRRLAEGLVRSSQPIKIKLLDQTLVAGIGNIYASEALFHAAISPLTPARELNEEEINRLWKAMRKVLSQAIRFGSTVPLTFQTSGRGDGLFYFGSASEEPGFYQERLLVYDREGLPCRDCARPIQRIFQAGRSTFFCGRCQKETA
jgi:formamidopyrimidine-DNA glycosylase